MSIKTECSDNNVYQPQAATSRGVRHFPKNSERSRRFCRHAEAGVAGPRFAPPVRQQCSQRCRRSVWWFSYCCHFRRRSRRAILRAFCRRRMVRARRPGRLTTAGPFPRSATPPHRTRCRSSVPPAARNCSRHRSLTPAARPWSCGPREILALSPRRPARLCPFPIPH